MLVEIPIWVAWAAGVAIFIVLVVFVAYVVRLAVVSTKSLMVLQELHPVIVDMAKQFKNDSGSSALDLIQKTSQATKDAQLAAADAKVTAADAVRTTVSLQRSLDLLTAQQQRLEDVIQYSANKTQQTMNMIQAQPQSSIGQAAAGHQMEQQVVDPVKVVIVPDAPVPVTVVPQEGK